MKCAYCGNEIPFNAAICPSCGVQIPQGEQQQYQQPMQQQYQQPTQPMVGQVIQNDVAYNTMLMSGKSRTAYIILAILLGEFGIHSFYAGYSGKGTVQLLITVLSAGSGSFISWLWAVSDIFSVKSDARGIPFK